MNYDFVLNEYDKELNENLKRKLTDDIAFLVKKNVDITKDKDYHKDTEESKEDKMSVMVVLKSKNGIVVATDSRKTIKNNMGQISYDDSQQKIYAKDNAGFGIIGPIYNKNDYDYNDFFEEKILRQNMNFEALSNEITKDSKIYHEMERYSDNYQNTLALIKNEELYLINCSLKKVAIEKILDDGIYIFGGFDYELKLFLQRKLKMPFDMTYKGLKAKAKEIIKTVISMNTMLGDFSIGGKVQILGLDKSAGKLEILREE